ncbi:permease [Hoeflea marina]|nr:permease [Hoeflea marina]
MRLLKSLEELLYELVSWLIFYPVTMWRAVSNPLQMMRYADVELSDRPEQQYEDTLSPPLFLLITLMIAQALSSALPSIYEHAAIPKALSTGSNLLIVRGVIFSAFPLVMATSLLRRKGVRLTRDTLRPPFYSQCYVAAPFVLLLGLGLDLMLIPQQRGLATGLAAVLAAVLWYGQAETRWFMRDLRIGAVRAAALVAGGMALAAAVTLLLALAIGLALKDSTG